MWVRYSWKFYYRSSYGIVLGKRTFNSSELPVLSEALRFTIFCKPSGVRCSLLYTSITICLNISKSARFWLIKGYSSKNGIITLTKSEIELTWKRIKLFEPILKLPTPKWAAILSNKAISLLWRPIVNLGQILYPLLRAVSLLIESPQLPSPSVNPIIYQGLRGAKLEVWDCGPRAFIFILVFLYIYYS